MWLGTIEKCLMDLMGFVSVQRGGVPKLTGSCSARCSHCEFVTVGIMFLVQEVSLVELIKV